MAHREIADPRDERIADYRGVRDPEWLGRRRVFIVEGRDALARCIHSGRFELRSVLATPTSLAALSGTLAKLPEHVPVYAAPRPVLEAAGGFGFHQGCLAAGVCPAPEPLTEWIAGRSGAARVVVLDDVTNPDNVGSVFRNALAFGAAGVIASERSAHPLYRKATRTSIGAVFRLPWTIAPDAPSALVALAAAGFGCAALTPEPDALDIAAFEPRAQRLALVLGHEGYGVSPAALARCDLRLRIPVSREAESINVAAASAIALHRLLGRGRES